MIYVTHITKRERKDALRDVYDIEPVAPKFNPWSACLITFNRRDHPTNIRHGGLAALVLDPIIGRVPIGSLKITLSVFRTHTQLSPVLGM